MNRRGINLQMCLQNQWIVTTESSNWAVECEFLFFQYLHPGILLLSSSTDRKFHQRSRKASLVSPVLFPSESRWRTEAGANGLDHSLRYLAIQRVLP
jgi:hypothetical protein